MEVKKKHFLEIADFNIKIEANHEFSLLIEEGYSSFIKSEKSEHVDTEIKSFCGIPQEFLREENILYKAVQNNQPFWTICRFENKYKFIIYDQEDRSRIQQVAFVNTEFKHWEIYSPLTEPSIEGDTQGVCPLLYPMGPLILYYLTVNNEAIMIHASGVFDGAKGRIFSGFSGVGKSTMAGIWKNAGSTVINDDRLIIRKMDEAYFMFNTPMFYIDMPRKAILNHIYLPYHSPTNRIKKIKDAKAVSRLMAYCIQHGYNKDFVEHHLTFLSEMSNHIDVSELGFKPDREVVDFISEYESCKN